MIFQKGPPTDPIWDNPYFNFRDLLKKGTRRFSNLGGRVF